MSEDGDREIGIATRWNERGFGFIRAQCDGSDIFCHCSAILDGNCLTNGAKVEFLRTVDERTGKHRAEKVTGGSQEEDAAPESSKLRMAAPDTTGDDLIRLSNELCLLSIMPFHGNG